MIEIFTLSPSCTNSDRSRQPTDVVFVPRGVDLALGFQRARPLLQQRRVVQIVGNGVTFSENWPSWVTTEPNLLLTELGAYQPKDLAAEFLPLRADIERHASYIDSWAQIMRKDSKAFAKACSLAQAAADYLLGHAAEDEDVEVVELAQAA